MNAAGSNLVVVAGNVYFCRFRETDPAPAIRAQCAEAIVREVREAVDAIAAASRDLTAANLRLLEEADRESSDLIEVAGILDDIAFHSHILAVECERTRAVGPGSEELRQLLRGGAAVATDVLAWVCEAVARAQNASRVLHDIAGRVRAIGRGVTEKIETAGPQPPEARHSH